MTAENKVFVWNNARNVSLLIVNIILLLLGFGWMIVGAIILGSILLDSDVNTILNTITVLSSGLGDNIKILSAMLIVIGVLIMVDASLAVVLSLLFHTDIPQLIWKFMLIIHFIIGILLFVSTVAVFGLWIRVGSKITEGDAKVQMVNKLHNDFTEDSISGADTISNSWNMIFMDLDCCAVEAVVSTSNDFDLTPWCTTSGECQQTNSQIPKTCCNGVTESTYSLAPSACYATVSSGTYNTKGCYEVLKDKIDPYPPAVIGLGVPLFITEILALFLAGLLFLKVFCTDSKDNNLKDLRSRVCKPKENKVAGKTDK